MACRVEKDGTTITVVGAGGNGAGPKLQARSIDVPGDISSAVFFIAAASMFADSNIMIHGIGLNPTRTAILDVFAQMGASLQVLSLQSAHGEVIGDLAVKGTSLKGGVIEKEQVPLVIDELPMLAALGPYTEEGIEIRDAAGIARERERSHRGAGGKSAAHGRDSRRAQRRIESRGPRRRKIARRRDRTAWRPSHRDGVCGGGARSRRRHDIRDADCAGVSYPTFYEDLERTAERLSSCVRRLDRHLEIALKGGALRPADASLGPDPKSRDFVSAF